MNELLCMWEVNLLNPAIYWLCAPFLVSPCWIERRRPDEELREMDSKNKITEVMVGNMQLHYNETTRTQATQANFPTNYPVTIQYLNNRISTNVLYFAKMYIICSITVQKHISIEEESSRNSPQICCSASKTDIQNLYENLYGWPGFE